MADDHLEKNGSKGILDADDCGKNVTMSSWSSRELSRPSPYPRLAAWLLREGASEAQTRDLVLGQAENLVAVEERVMVDQMRLDLVFPNEAVAAGFCVKIELLQLTLPSALSVTRMPVADLGYHLAPVLNEPELLTLAAYSPKANLFSTPLLVDWEDPGTGLQARFFSVVDVNLFLHSRGLRDEHRSLGALKELSQMMLMAHLDIIQQQGETILSKDKLLKSLREDNNLLKQKLDRRLRPGEEEGGKRGAGSGRKGGKPLEGEERRGQKRELERGTAGRERPCKRQSRLPDPQEPVKEEVGEEEEDIDEEFADQSLPKTPLPEHRVEMIDSVDELQDEFCMQTSPELRELPRAEVRRRIVTSDEEVEEEQEQDNRQKPLQSKGKGGGSGRKKARTSLEEESKEIKKGRNSLSGSTIHPPPPPAPAVPTLSTANLYFVGCKNDQQAISVEDKLTEVPSLQRGVEVPKWREDKNHYALCVYNKISLKKSKEGGPTWRIKSTNPLYTTEAAEPTDDASYLKRHDKREKDEKQRKRWDAQRMRQEQQLQKLRARQEKKTLDQSKSKADLNCQGTSLLPALEEVTAICVEDVVPVSIFGRPLPDTGTVDFSLPWL